MNRREVLTTLLAGMSTSMFMAEASAPTDGLSLNRDDMERFLRTAAIQRMKILSEGVTNSQRALLADGCLTHEAHVQTIDEYKQVFRSMRGIYLNFADTYKHNIAAYLLDKMLDLRMVPVSVERKVRGSTAAVTWWVDNVLMSEKDRYLKKMSVPDPNGWNRQIHCVRVFDELIYNIDRNLGNILITRDWTVWMIDHTRAFRPDRDLRNEKNLARCDRRLLAALQRLNFEDLTAELGRYVYKLQIDALLKRRDRIIGFFQSAVRDKGEAAVLYDYLPRPSQIELPVDKGSTPCRDPA